MSGYELSKDIRFKKPGRSLKISYPKNRIFRPRNLVKGDDEKLKLSFLPSILYVLD